MSRTDVSYLGGRFRVEVEPDPTWPFGRRYKALISQIEDGIHPPRIEHPLVFPDGARMVFYGETEPHAYNAAVAYLAERFGGFSETPISASAPGTGTIPGKPRVLHDAGAH